MGIDYSASILIGLYIDSEIDEDFFEKDDIEGYPIEHAGNLWIGDCNYFLVAERQYVDFEDVLCQKVALHKNIAKHKSEMKIKLEPLGLWNEDDFGLWLVGAIT